MLILQTLARGKPLHGFEIAESIQQTSADVLQVEEGSLYPALQRMLKAGWIDAEWGMSPRHRKVRIYRITRAGRKRLEHEISSFEQMLEGIARVMRPVRS